MYFIVLKKYRIHLLAGAQTDPSFTTENEFWLEKSTISLDNDRTGVLNNTQELSVIQFRNGLQNQYKYSKTDPMNEYKDDLVVVFNFVMDNQATFYTRKHYTLIDLFEE